MRFGQRREAGGQSTGRVFGTSLAVRRAGGHWCVEGRGLADQDCKLSPCSRVQTSSLLRSLHMSFKFPQHPRCQALHTRQNALKAAKRALSPGARGNPKRASLNRHAAVPPLQRHCVLPPWLGSTRSARCPRAHKPVAWSTALPRGKGAKLRGAKAAERAAACSVG